MNAPDEERWGGRPIARRVADAAPRRRVRTSGVLRAVAVRAWVGGDTLECELDDGSGTLTVVFPGRRWVPGIRPGARLAIEGTVGLHEGRQVVANPLYSFAAPQEASPPPGGPECGPQEGGSPGTSW